MIEYTTVLSKEESKEEPDTGTVEKINKERLDEQNNMTYQV